MQGISSFASPSDVCQLKPPTNILLGGSGEERVRRGGERGRETNEKRGGIAPTIKTNK